MTLEARAFASLRLGVIAAAVCFGNIVVADWPFARGGSNSSGATDISLPDEPKVLWTYEAEGSSLEATPVITGGIAYFGDVDGTVHAVRVSDGSLVWKEAFEKTGFLSPGAVAGDAVYVVDMDGVVHCLATSDGAERWTYDTDSEAYGGPLVHQPKDGPSLLLVPTEGGKLHALDATSGKERWAFEIEAPLRCTPTVVAGNALLAGCDGELHAIDAATGQETGACDIGEPTGNSAAVAGGVAYFGAESGEFFAIDAADPTAPEVKWSYRDPRRGQGIRTSAALSATTVVYANQAKTVYGLNRADGKELWNRPMRSRVEASPLVLAGGRVLIATSRGRVLLLDATTGEEAWSYDAGGGYLGSPAASDGVVLLPNTDGRLDALGQ